MANFIRNIRAVNQGFPYLASTLQGRRDLGEYAMPGGKILHADVPSTNESANSPAWRERVAVPFSISKKGQKTYGIIYMPESEAFSQLHKNTTSFGGDVEIYGGETMDGRSFTPEGLNKIVQDSDEDSFTIEVDLVPSSERANVRKYSKGELIQDKTKTGVQGVKASNANGLKSLRQNVIAAQANASNKNNRAATNFIDYFRESRRGF